MTYIPKIKYYDIGNIYGIRTWVEYGLKQSKNELGWADFRVTNYAQIEKWWELVMSAYLMVSLHLDSLNKSLLTIVSKQRKKAHIPSKVRFARKTQLAKGMLQSAIKAGIRPAWFVADEVYRRDASFWRWLEQMARQPYVLTVNKRQPTPINFQTCYAEDLVRTIPPEG